MKQHRPLRVGNLFLVSCDSKKTASTHPEMEKYNHCWLRVTEVLDENRGFYRAKILREDNLWIKRSLDIEAPVIWYWQPQHISAAINEEGALIRNLHSEDSTPIALLTEKLPDI